MGMGPGSSKSTLVWYTPACCRIDRLAECLAFDGLENVRQPVLSFLSQSVNQVLELVAQFLPHFSQPLEPELHCQREHVDGGRPAHEHRLAYGSDGGEHGCGCQQRLAHLLGLPLRGMVGMPTRLQESAGCVSVEQGAPSASTVALPIHISDSDMPLTSGAGCRTNAGRCTMPMPACAIHWLCTFTVGAIP